MTLLIAVDPGKMTGVALFEFFEDGVPELLESHEFLRDELEAWLETKLLKNYTGDDIEVVAERFKIGDIDAPWSLQELGVLSFLSRKGGWGEPTLQTPADAKAFVSNEKIKKLGYWHKGGAGHALDAVRHGVLYMVRKQLLSPGAMLS